MTTHLQMGTIWVRQLMSAQPSTGLRAGEALAIHVEDLDLTQAIVHDLQARQAIVHDLQARLAEPE